MLLRLRRPVGESTQELLRTLLSGSEKARLLFGLYVSEDSQSRHTTVEVWHPGLGQWKYIEPRDHVPTGAVRLQHLIDRIFDDPNWKGSSLADLSRLPATKKALPDGIVASVASRFTAVP